MALHQAFANNLTFNTGTVPYGDNLGKFNINSSDPMFLNAQWY